MGAKLTEARLKAACKISAAEGPALLTKEQVGEILQISTRSVWRKAICGEIPPPIKLGHLVRWRRDILFSWIENDCQGV